MNSRNALLGFLLLAPVLCAAGAQEAVRESCRDTQLRKARAAIEEIEKSVGDATQEVALPVLAEIALLWVQAGDVDRGLTLYSTLVEGLGPAAEAHELRGRASH